MSIALRPCSRCVSNGKQDACVDVQHKKRGRPRLRDEKDGRYEPTRFPHPSEAATRPLSIHPAGNPEYEDPLRRTQSYRVLKTQQSESMTPRYLERGSVADANVYAPPLMGASRPPEPVAYLTMELVISSVSTTFMDAIGGFNPMGRNLTELLVSSELDKVLRVREQLREEQKRREPNYLPPIMGRGERILEGLGFSMEEVSRYNLDRQEYLAFAADGHPRHLPLRMSLAKEGSYYFVVLLLELGPQQPGPYSAAPTHAGEVGGPYHGQLPTPRPGFAQGTPVSSTFEPVRHRYSDRPSQPRQHATAPGHGGPPAHPIVSPRMPTYSPPPGQQGYGAGMPRYSTPRSEPIPPASLQQHQGYQLPPIRAQPDAGPPQRELGWQRDDRPSRVDIGGLIERPEGQEDRR